MLPHIYERTAVLAENTMSLFSKKEPLYSLLAPADGRLIPLESLPDEAFSQKLLGEGFAVTPTSGNVYAPASGTVGTVSQVGHAVTILTPDGLDLLVHVGIDTVTLGSDPFQVLVAVGQQIGAGDPILKVDLDAIRAASLPTEIPVLITNRECLTSLLTECGDCIGGQTVAATYQIS